MVVRMRANRSKTGKRRSHAAVHGVRVSTCECGALRVAHRACAECGKYNGRVVVDVIARAKRTQRRAKRKQTELRQSGRDTENKETKETETAKAK